MVAQIQNTRESEICVPFKKIFCAYIQYLEIHRGLRGTFWGEKHYVQKLFKYLNSHGLKNISQINISMIIDFIIQEQEANNLHRSTASKLCQIIRSLMRFLYIYGYIKNNLATHVPKPHIFREENLPYFISRNQVQDIITSINQNTLIGNRDYAIILMIATYGFRACEVRKLRLNDIDWQKEQIRIQRGKRQTAAVYPLERNVGEALVLYLQKSRPSSSYRELFLSSQKPITPLSTSGISVMVAKYFKLANINAIHFGPHTLRHSCAKRLVDEGFSLKTIGDYLGHTHPESTHIYTKVATEDLREVANSDAEELI